jgi:hypothetical protein
VLFSGDAFNPSMMSTITLGKQMVRDREEEACKLWSTQLWLLTHLRTTAAPCRLLQVPVLNAAGVAAACFGNHDADFGLDNFSSLRQACNFPWLLSNVLDTGTGGHLGMFLQGHRYCTAADTLPCRWSDGALLIHAVCHVCAGEPLGGCARSVVIEHGGVRVGLMGLAESEW